MPGREKRQTGGLLARLVAYPWARGCRTVMTGRPRGETRPHPAQSSGGRGGEQQETPAALVPSRRFGIRAAFEPLSHGLSLCASL